MFTGCRLDSSLRTLVGLPAVFFLGGSSFPTLPGFFTATFSGASVLDDFLRAAFFLGFSDSVAVVVATGEPISWVEGWLLSSLLLDLLLQSNA